MTSPYQSEDGMKECLYFTQSPDTPEQSNFFLVHIYFYLFTIYLSFYT